MKEKVLEAFAELGFELTPMEDFFGFDYENMHLLYMPASNDENFLNISVPGIYDLEVGNQKQFVELTNKINSMLKYIKAYELGESLWLFYERELLGDEDLPTLITRIVLHLEAALAFSRMTIAEMEQEVLSGDIVEAIDLDDEDNDNN